MADSINHGILAGEFIQASGQWVQVRLRGSFRDPSGSWVDTVTDVPVKVTGKLYDAEQLAKLKAGWPVVIYFEVDYKNNKVELVATRKPRALFLTEKKDQQERDDPRQLAAAGGGESYASADDEPPF